MWQAGTVVTRCSLHVRLVPSEPGPARVWEATAARTAAPIYFLPVSLEKAPPS